MQNKVNKLRENIANCLTMLNMTCGAASIIASINHRFTWAIAFVGFAAVFDRYDGIVARKLHTNSELGVQLDSMADGLSFGVAPALLTYLSQFHGVNSFRYISEIIFVVYICAGLFRLARYNISGLDDSGNFMGVPITAAGMFLAMSLLFRNVVPYYVYGILMILFAYLMVSKISVKKR